MTAPGRPCPRIRCPNLQPCADHPARKPFANAQRTGTALYRTSRWKRERARYLAAYPLCCAPLQNGGVCMATATVVDHRQPHRGDADLFWNDLNWQSLCAHHHNAKTGRETRERAYGR